MKALLIGGTGNISLPITRKLLAQGWQVTLLNRGTKNNLVPGAEHIQCDINDEQAAQSALQGRTFDVAAQFIAFKQEQVERDIRLLKGKTGQYIFISSASAYIKPLRNRIITESTPLSNPYWQYSRDKIACETALNAARDSGFPMTIVRPSPYIRQERCRCRSTEARALAGHPADPPGKAGADPRGWHQPVDGDLGG